VLSQYIFSAVSHSSMTFPRQPLLILLASWGSYFSYLFLNMIRWRPDGLYVGHQNVWSDWALHIAMAQTFAFKSPALWFAYHPLYAGGQFTYPSLTNLISGLLMRLGFSLPAAFIIPSLLFVFALLMGLYLMFSLLLRSKWSAVLAISLFFLSAGLGFTHFLPAWLAGTASLTYPPQDYSSLPEYQWYAGNVAVGLLIPQRAFLLGLTLSVWVIVGLLTVLKQPTPSWQNRGVLLFAGLGAGLLPIAHSHSFIVMIIFTGLLCLSYFRHWRLLLWYVVPAGLLSSFLFLTFIAGGIESKSFIQWQPGWVANGSLGEWLWFWGYVWGPMMPLAIFGLWHAYRRPQKLLLVLGLGALCVFGLANLVVFQPVAWDNTKLLWWVYLVFSGLVALLLQQLWSHRYWQKAVAGILLFILMATGGLELIRLGRIDQHVFQITSRDDIALGHELRQATAPTARFLTAPQHNHFVMVWALRPILMGYTAWVWNFGFDHTQRERDIHSMYSGAENANELLARYQVSYVVIGPTERGDLQANESFFANQFPLSFSNRNNNIYDTRRLW
jgi:hypothetical protein